MKTKNYRVYGLVIRSEIHFSELIETDEIHDIEITYNSIPQKLKNITGEKNQVYFSQNDFVLCIGSGTYFYISNGNKITIEVNTETNYRTIKLFILGTCMGAILMQRGIIPLHGSAISYKDKGVLVLGDSGAGKSTVVSFFLSKGGLLLSDDVIPITIKHNKYYAISSYPQQKLCSDVLDQQGVNTTIFDKVPYLVNNRNKYYIDRKEQFRDGMVQIDRVFNLAATDINEPSIERVSGMKKVELLMKNIYRYEFIRGFKLQKKSFDICSGISLQSPIYFIQRPYNYYNPDRIIDIIEKLI